MGEPVVSGDVLLCARRLELAWRSGRALSPGECRALAAILNVAAFDVAAMEDMPVAVGEVQPAPDVAAWPAHSRCVTPPPSGGGGAQIIPFRRRPGGDG